MSVTRRLFALAPWGVAVGAVAAAVWLYLDNRRLHEALAARGAPVDGPAAVVAEAGGDPWASGPSGDASGQRAATGGMWKALTRSQDRPELPEAGKKETRAERRVRRQMEIAAMMGRLDGETVEEYRARMVPFIEAGLAGPRQRLEDARAAAEAAANVSDDQRQEMDKVFADSFDEVIALTNQAVTGGDLTPYERNWSGMLNYAGGLGAILGATEGRIGQILTPDQQRTIYDTGFEWGEYLGTRVPWESIEPPPPPPGEGL